MGKRTIGDVSTTAIALADLKNQQKAEKSSFNREFSNIAVPEHEGEAPFEMPKSMDLAQFIIFSLMRDYIGDDYANLTDIIYDYDEEGDYHVFEITPAGCDGEQDLAVFSEPEKAIYLSIKESISSFLDLLQGNMDRETGAVLVEDGLIYFETKMDLFRTLAHYADNMEIPIIDIHSHSSHIDYSRNFKGYKLDRKSLISEIIGTRYEISPEKDYSENLLFNTFNKPYLNKRDYIADSYITSISASHNAMLFSIFFNLMRDQICLEDNLDKNRTYQLDLDKPPLPMTIN